MSQSNSSVPARLSYAGAAARLAPSKITVAPNSTRSAPAPPPPPPTEEYPSLVPNRPQPPAPTNNNNNGHCWQKPQPTAPTATASHNGSVCPRRWEAPTQVANTTTPVASVLEPIPAPSTEPVESAKVESLKNGAVASETVESTATAVAEEPVPELPAEEKGNSTSPSSPGVSQANATKSWADLLKKPSQEPVEAVEKAGESHEPESPCQKVPDITPGSGDNSMLVPELSVSIQHTNTFSSDETNKERVEDDTGDAQQQSYMVLPEEQMTYAPEKMYGPPPMFPMSPQQQYGFMMPQFAPMQPIPIFIHPHQAYFQHPELIQMNFSHPPPMQPFYPTPVNGVIAEPMMDGSTRFRYPEPNHDQPPPYTQVCPPPPARRDDNWNTAVERLERETRIREKVDLLIGGRFRVVQKINMGSCGSIYTALDEQSEDNKLVAVKFETYKDRESHLIHEYEVYQTCSTFVDENDVVHGAAREGFGQVLFMGVEYGYRILVMELLGPSLENLFGYSFSRFTPETTYKLGMQMLDRIEELHECGFIHRDMKPDNFVMGLREKEETVYLLDFGLTRKFRPNRENQPGIRRGRGVVGTAKYASINSHNGLELSRRDDLESIAYILLEFITGDVPWKEKSRKPKQTFYNRMRQIKEEMQWKVVCPELAPWMDYVMKLTFNEKPDYDVLRNVLRRYVENPQPSGKTPLMEHLARLGDGTEIQPRQRIGQRQRKQAAKGQTDASQAALSVDERIQQSKFEWIRRRESSVNETYTYQCLFLWTLPYGHEPIRPLDTNPSMKFGYGFGEGGFA